VAIRTSCDRCGRDTGVSILRLTKESVSGLYIPYRLSDDSKSLRNIHACGDCVAAIEREFDPKPASR
jgi:hypothetical protein